MPFFLYNGVIRQGFNLPGKELQRAPPPGTGSVWLGVCKAGGRHTTVDWWPTQEEAHACLEANGVHDHYDVDEVPIVDGGGVEVFLGRFTGKQELETQETFVVWTDCVLTRGIHDLPAGTKLDQIQLDLQTGELYYHALNGVLLATEKIVA